ncbi:DUF86 domain-containing protein [Aquibacillus rhizosphaerae]|uniref:DUF86 domain-containing protein n=1 Tax=Aquibacillus rhizosphaerae TaxID=3051431 RepID=A0ABT7L273_9BACI|nr:DUF86 domain-containing protein [Aquibacillus sp. LR5S19]MDL4839951.1 DUF86 domain-containing protein [Aquibacillus sp. LR5S19]
MYFVDRNKIEKTLLYMEGLFQVLENHTFDSFLEKLSLERIVHMTIESMLDVGNMMIDGFIMRDPGSFEDIIDILVDEQVLPQTESDSYKEIVKLRKMLINDYLNINHDLILETVHRNQYSLEMFCQRIREYLDNETGVATAFSK